MCLTILSKQAINIEDNPHLAKFTSDVAVADLAGKRSTNKVLETVNGYIDPKAIRNANTRIGATLTCF
ncbi:unnamed protein product [[Candida] boidinii]|nr:unnamed protein product [[Candida] boidinii]